MWISVIAFSLIEFSVREQMREHVHDVNNRAETDEDKNYSPKPDMVIVYASLLA